jgi:hypothetical protein
VAAKFFVLEAGELERRLSAIPGLAGRNINLACVAIAGYKQPQQLLAVNYLISLGARIDLLINIDGFNEITLPFNDNYPNGVFVFYPTMWKDLTAGLGDARRRTLIGELTLADGVRTTLTGWFSSAVLDRSMIANLTRVLADNVLSGKARQLLDELERSPGTLATFQKGPSNEGSPDELRERLAENWAVSSRLVNDLAKSGRFAYVHVLQPNQYVPGSKPLSEREREIAISTTPGVAETTARGYELLAGRIPELKEGGVDFLDATMVFQYVREDLYFDTCCHFNKQGNDILLDAYAFMSREVVSANYGPGLTVPTPGHAARFRTGPVFQPHRAAGESRPPCQKRPAGGAQGVVLFIGPQVSHIDEAQSGLDADPFGHGQGGRGRWRSVGHAVVRVEPGKVPGRIRSDLGDQERGHLPQFRFGVVEARDEQCGHFQPPAQLADVRQILFHGFEPGSAHVAIEIVGEGLEVDIGRVDERGQFLQALGALESVGDHDVFKPLPFGLSCGVAHELEKNRGFGIGVGDARRAAFQGGGHKLLGRDVPSFDGASGSRRLGQEGILAEQAREVAAHGPEGKGHGPGQEVVRGFFSTGSRFVAATLA